MIRTSSSPFTFWRTALLLLGLATLGVAAASAAGPAGPVGNLPLPLDHYVALETAKAAELGVEQLSLWETLKLRATEDPLNVIATLLFLGAVLHTFFAGKFAAIAHRLEHHHEEDLAKSGRTFTEGRRPVSLKATIFHFLGEVEAVFGIWLIPLFLTIFFYPDRGWTALAGYVDSRNYTEPMFVFVIMAIAASRPIIALADRSLRTVAALGKGSPAAWWISILVVAPLLGSFITEPAAITIAAMLLGQQFYRFEPSQKLKYATLGLLFVNISIGGTLTHFAAPPVLMVASTWNWDFMFMLTHFGWRAVLSILISTGLYFMIFRQEFAVLLTKSKVDAAHSEEVDSEAPPFWIMATHCGFLGWTVLTLHHPAFFVEGLLLFIAFTVATGHHQNSLQLKAPLLVGFFLASLVTHGGFQTWWIAPVLGALTETPLFLGATVLTAFNDNAAITYLASLVPAFSPYEMVDGVLVAKSPEAMAEVVKMQYAVVAGAVAGGGLTVIANAPNPAGQSLLKGYFQGGVSPLYLLAGAITPTIIVCLIFILLPH